MESSLLDKLPKITGRYIENADLKKLVWFRVGGPAQVLFKPKDTEDLCHFLQKCPKNIPITIIGVGSNLLIRDGGIPGVVIKLGRAFSKIHVEGNTIIAGGGALDRTVSLTAAEHKIGGLEFFAGIPGTIGGAVKMNAGCYGTEVKDIFKWCKVVCANGTIKTLTKDTIQFQYRHSDINDSCIILEACFEGAPEKKENILKRINQIMNEREDSQPTRARTGGSTFKNPSGSKAWELIDGAGCRGHKIGGAIVSMKHCNFLINEGDATAADIENLGNYVKKAVKERHNVDLDWEIKRVGIFNDPEKETIKN
jgi:UDP-N-acetylmuramate dehydrogenase